MKNLLLFLGFIFTLNCTFAQISKGGLPESFQSAVYTEAIPIIELQKPDMRLINQQDQDALLDQKIEPRRMAVAVAADMDLVTDSKHQKLANGYETWMISLKIPGALALGLYFDKFVMPEHGKLYIYSADREQVIGAFDNSSKGNGDLFATEFIKGDQLIIEYNQPQGAGEPDIHIYELAYAYRDISFEKINDGNRDSWYCMIDVACEEGDGWEDQASGVARISIKIGSSFFWCSGSLINNTEFDRTPYFLTAAHCGGSASTADLNQWIFYFNYQASTCDGNGGGSQTMTGCQLRARDDTEGDDGSDFYLVELNQTPPTFYNLFYNGWNRTNQNNEMGAGVCIHHPNGDIKKISTYDIPLINSTFWNGLPSHWRVQWAETANGRSIVQGGSSGSPIFDEEKRIVGDLTGGYTSNSCENPSPAFYGKIWYSWDRNGTSASERLKDWLDPNDLGYEKISGVSWQVIEPNADFSADVLNITQGDTVYFEDLSEPYIFQWEWVFEEASIDTSYSKNPGPVQYTEVGTFDVKLRVENGDGTDEEIKSGYINVQPQAPPICDFQADETQIIKEESVTFSDLSSGNPINWFWEFEGGSPATSTFKNPTISYNEPGTYQVKLTVSNYGGSDEMIKEAYIEVVDAVLPEAEFFTYTPQIQQGQTVNFFDESTGDPYAWEWVFIGGIPVFSTDQHPSDILYEVPGYHNVMLKVTNEWGESTLLKEDYILVWWVGVDEHFDKYFTLYPNPSNGRFVLENENTDISVCKIKILNIKGQLVYEDQQADLSKAYLVDLDQLEAGTYVLHIVTDEEQFSRKLQISSN